MLTQDWLNLLAADAARLIDLPLAELIAAEPDRSDRDTLRAGPLLLCLARQRIDAAAWQRLYQVAAQRELPARLRRLVDGERVNRSEDRPALHTALRGDVGRGETALLARQMAQQTLADAARIADSLLQDGITDLINVGIGGSDLGPRLVFDALGGATARLRVHFLSSPDGHVVDALLRGLDPARTAVLLVSKSFGTEETLLNGRVVLDWLGGRGRVVAATANVDKAVAFGVPRDAILPLWDWVGGRYSLWSAVGFALLASLGLPVFQRLLDGAAAMDRHALETAAPLNLPLRHALTAVWNRNALGYDSVAVLPYDQRLRLLPAYLQQLVMESLGKSVREDGSVMLGNATVPVLWGGSGTDCQHSFFQALHQGTDTVPTEFVGVLRPDHGHAPMHQMLLANLLAQGEALANGVAGSDLHRRYPGSRPSSVLLLDALTPEALGGLIALHEHSVFLQAAIWGVNAFDQWGVELGKITARRLAPAVADPAQTAADPVTARLLAELHRA